VQYEIDVVVMEPVRDWAKLLGTASLQAVVTLNFGRANETRELISRLIQPTMVRGVQHIASPAAAHYEIGSVNIRRQDGAGAVFSPGGTGPRLPDAEEEGHLVVDWPGHSASQRAAAFFSHPAMGFALQLAAVLLVVALVVKVRGRVNSPDS
jgi:hypothetical protein